MGADVWQKEMGWLLRLVEGERCQAWVQEGDADTPVPLHAKISRGDQVAVCPEQVAMLWITFARSADRQLPGVPGNRRMDSPRSL